jgi:hypothetical protein
MRYKKFIKLLMIPLLAWGCVSKFIPEINENTEAVVVDGLITDQPGSDTIKLYKTIPLGKKAEADPVEGCIVTISDDLGNSYDLFETSPGIYITDADEFCGTIGRKYTLRIFTSGISGNKYTYESVPMEMKPVPPIDTLWYEKVLIEEETPYSNRKEGCNIYLDTHDPLDKCTYYRWDYRETWEMQIPYYVPNKVCWVSKQSGNIMIKNTSVLSENRISRFPVKSVSHESDRLNIKYSILVNQYSLNDNEYVYWEKIQNIVEEVGSLYDITPASVPGNIYCLEDPNEKVLGYFSVSAKTSKRIFIDDYFSGQANLYLECPMDTVSGGKVIPGLGLYLWIIITFPNKDVVITDDKNCYDCAMRGTNIRPSYWDDNR